MSSRATSSRAVLPAATSTLVAGVVAGPTVRSTVVAAHRFALYLDVAGHVLPVVTADAVSLPTAVRLAARAGEVEWGVGHGDTVEVGEGRIALPALDVVAVRTWRPSRVRRARVSGDEGGRGCRGNRFRTHEQLVRAGSPGGSSDWLAAGIRRVVSTVPAGGVEEAVAELVGRGPGLTPSGDDALAGALLVAHALGAAAPLAAAVRARLDATTAVSAALLDAAADGCAARPVVALVDAAVAGDVDAVRRALPAVLAIGHTSGADTVTGIREALSTGERDGAAHPTSTRRSAA